MTLATPTRCTFEDFKAHRAHIAEKMSRYGGSFAKCIATAIRAADPNNLRTIYNAFPDILQPYEPGGRFYDA